MESWIAVVVSLIGGGACGAFLKEWFDKKRGRTRELPLIELVNRNPLLYELKGIKLSRDASEGQPSEVTNIRHYQFRLRNTSGMHLRDAHIQFKFGKAETIEPWVSPPEISKVELIAVEPTAISSPWEQAFRWKIPQLADGDSVEFGFQSVNPETPEYEAFIDSQENLVLSATKTDPIHIQHSSRQRALSFIFGTATSLFIANFLYTISGDEGL